MATTTIGLFFLLFLFVVCVVVCLFIIWVVFRTVRSDAGPSAARIHQGPPQTAPNAAARFTPAAPRNGETTAACPECGGALPADSPHGLCARCLLQRALLSPRQTGGPAPSGAAPFVAPDAADLATHFPQLEILGLIGQGGMGAVYRARQHKLDRMVALKVLPAEWGRDPAFAERFQREARALARLNHPHIVAVHDFGEAGGHFYLLMEYVDGANLRQLLQAGPLDPRLALQIVPQVCDALQYAHEEGVVHRDVKPENILLDARGRVKMADFGLAKLVGPAQASFTLTGTHQVMGTLDYMAPEQRSNPQQVDHRADIYSLGVVFYEMLTGEVPLGRFTPPSQASGVDVRIDDVIFRALEREPDRRFQRVSEVRDGVESANGRAPAVETGVPARAAPPSEYTQLEVQGPAAALFVAAVIAVLQWVVAALLILDTASGRYGGRPAEMEATLAFFMLFIAVTLGAIIAIGSVKLRQFQDYTYVVVAVILAMVPWSLHCLIGIPAGVWAFWALSRLEVRAAFAAELRPRAGRKGVRPDLKSPAAPAPRKAVSFWRAFRSVFVSSPRRDEPSFSDPPAAPR